MSSIPQLAEWWVLNPWVGIVSLIIAVLSAILMIILHIKGKKVKLPCYTFRSNNLVKDLFSRIGPLEMRYSGQQIENLTVTKIAFWNAGRDTIDKRDIVSADPPTVHVKEGYKILEPIKLYAINPSNQFSTITSEDRSYFTLQFDYVDKGEGVVIQFFHTGLSSEDVEISGRIKGAGELIYKFAPNLERHSILLPSSLLSSRHPSLSVKKRRYNILLAMFIIPVVSVVLFVLLLWTVANVVITEEPFLSATFMPAIVIYLIVYWGLGFYLLKRRIPKGFDAFEEEFEF
jgi:hypothetical protein